MAATTRTSNVASPNSAPQSDELSFAARVAALREAVIDFIPNASFPARLPSSAERPSQHVPAADEAPAAPAHLPAHLRRLCEAELLNHEQEAALFCEMNFAKFQAHSLREALDSESPDPQTVEAIELLLAHAHEIRDHLIKANMRLVMSLAKKFVTPQQSFDEILSDGIIVLMNAVEKFDFDRGFRFSTYAYRSIARNAYRSMTSAQKEEARLTRDAEDWAFEDARGHASSSMSEQMWEGLREMLGSMLDHLDRRERFIIRSRYALGSHRKARTFQYLADKLGVSKERVRQLERRAVAKLQDYAANENTDELLGAALL